MPGNVQLSIDDEHAVAKNQSRYESSEYKCWVEENGREPPAVSGPDGRRVLLLANDTARSSSYVSFRLRCCGDGQALALPDLQVTALQLFTSTMQSPSGTSGDFQYVQGTVPTRDVSQTLGKHKQGLRENLQHFSKTKNGKMQLGAYREQLEHELRTSGEVQVRLRIGDVSKVHNNHLFHVAVTVEHQGTQYLLRTAPIHVLSSLPEQIFLKKRNGPKKRRAQEAAGQADQGCPHLSKRLRVALARLEPEALAHLQSLSAEDCEVQLSGGLQLSWTVPVKQEQ